MKMFWYHIVVIVAQVCEYTATTKLHSLKGWILWHVNYSSIKKRMRECKGPCIARLGWSLSRTMLNINWESNTIMLWPLSLPTWKMSQEKADKSRESSRAKQSLKKQVGIFFWEVFNNFCRRQTKKKQKSTLFLTICLSFLCCKGLRIIQVTVMG